RAMAAFNAARSVARTRWRVAGPVRMPDACLAAYLVRAPASLGGSPCFGAGGRPADERSALREGEEARRLLRRREARTSRVTVGEGHGIWRGSEKTSKATSKGYGPHVRVHPKPRIGHIRLSRLNVGHLVEMFDAIADEN
ncbi:hypothetical protein UK12_33235, partial [Saccharothrix sp. ST-888]